MERQDPQRDRSLTIVERGDEFLAMSRTGATLTLNALQFEVLQLADGSTTIEDIADECSDVFEQEIPPEAVEDFLSKARQLGMLSIRSTGFDDEALARSRCGRARRRLRRRSRWIRRCPAEAQRLHGEILTALEALEPSLALERVYALEEVVPSGRDVARTVQEIEDLGAPPAVGDGNPLFLTFPLVNPDRFLRKLARLCAPAFGGVGFLVWAAVVLQSVWLVLDLDVLAGAWDPSPEAAVTLYIMWAVSIAIHELSHALTCVHFGGKVESMGLGLMWGVIPFAFADVTSSYLIERKSQRQWIMIAGTMGSMFTIAVAVYLIHWLPTESPIRIGAIWFIVASSATNLIFNLAPFLKLDGYYMLSDALDVPNLWSRSFDYSGKRLAALIVGESVSVPTVSRRDAWVLMAYAASTAVYATTLIGYTFTAVFAYVVPTWRGYGLAAFLLGFGLLFGRSMVRMVRGLWKHRGAFKSPRVLLRAGLPALALVLLVTVPRFPESAVASYRIRAALQIPATTSVPGQISRVFVDEGSVVEAGQTVAVLRSLEVSRRAARAQYAMERAQAQLEVCLNGARQAEVEAAAADVGTWSARRRLNATQYERNQRLAREAAVPLAELEHTRIQLRAVSARERESELLRELVVDGCRPEEVDVLRAKVDAYGQALEHARADEQALVIVSPIAGRVIDRNPRERVGEWIETGEPVVRVHSNQAMVAELVPDWMFGSFFEQPALEAKLILPDGRAVHTRIAEAFPGDGGEGPRLLSDALDASPLHAGVEGPARIYGAPVSLLREYVVHPVQRIFVREFWTVL